MSKKSDTPKRITVIGKAIGFILAGVAAVITALHM